jgi:hypothetical protein
LQVLKIKCEIIIWQTITSLVRFNPNFWCFVRFEVSTAVTMKNGVFWVATPCGSCCS